MITARSFFVAAGLLLLAPIANADVIGDEICASATRHGSLADTLILDNACATVSATATEFSVPNFQGGGSLFELDFNADSFTIFADLADLSFMEPWTVVINSIDWIGVAGQLDSVTQTVFEGTWLNGIAFDANSITLTSDPATFIGGVTFTTSYAFTASHDDEPDPTPVPEPSTLALFGLGMVALGIARRRKHV